MVDSSIVVKELSYRASRELNLEAFPPLPKTIQPAVTPIATPGVGTNVGGSLVAGTRIGTKAWNLADQSLPFFPHDVLMKNGRVVVKASKEVLQDGAKQCENVLLANFLGKSPHIALFLKTVNKLWGMEGSIGCLNLALGIFNRMCLPGVMTKVFNLGSAPVWVKVWHVPLELYSQKGLDCLVSALGKPLYTNRATAWKQQLEFAKVCVDMTTTFLLPTSISMEVGDDRFIDVGVELAWSPPRCCSYAIFGHSKEKCPKKASIATVAAEATSDVACLDKGNDKDFTVGDSTVVTDVGISYSRNLKPKAKGKH
ncbi:hypothetical protein GQ457_17G006830 [Hibiscus cannabinus]